MNLDNYTIPKIIYEVLYNRLIYVNPKRILKAVKDADIPLNRKKVLNYHCKHYIISKSIYIISYTPLFPAVRLFTKIYINTVQYKSISSNGYKYTVYILDCYSNYQWIFFIKIED